MSETLVDGPVTVPFALARDEVDDLLAADLTRLDGDVLLGSWRELERLRNRLAAVEHRFVVEAERRGLASEHGARDVAGLLRGLLRLHPREAAARVHAADASAGRWTLTGEPTPAPFAHVAAAQAAGVISPRHAQVVVSTVESLPEAVQAEHGVRVERDLVGYAQRFDPFELGKIAIRIKTLFDQDGPEPGDEEQERRRGLDVQQRPDGTSRMILDATAELTERLLTTLDAMAKPKPGADGTPDPRSARQRNHDGLLDALNTLLRSDLVPASGGVSTTVLLTLSEQAWQTGRGTATTGHGAVIPAREAVRIAGGDYRLGTVRLNTEGAVVDWTDPRRFFTEVQRLVMAARDGGCSFPGCDVPPAWCQAHHVIEWSRGGPTIVANGTLVCGFHHREHSRQGWRCVMIDSRPAWIPPPWIDPDQQPRTNALHRQT